jgi:hypothetical protein
MKEKSQPWRPEHFARSVQSNWWSRTMQERTVGTGREQVWGVLPGRCRGGAKRQCMRSILEGSLPESGQQRRLKAAASSTQLEYCGILPESICCIHLFSCHNISAFRKPTLPHEMLASIKNLHFSEGSAGQLLRETAPGESLRKGVPWGRRVTLLSRGASRPPVKRAWGWTVGRIAQAGKRFRSLSGTQTPIARKRQRRAEAGLGRRSPAPGK